MYAIIIAAILTANGTPAKAYGDLVIVEGRPQCHGQALYNDPARPIVVCR